MRTASFRRCDRRLRRRKNGLAGTVLAVLFCSAGAPVRAEVLHLKNGRSIVVDRYWEDGNQIFYELNGGIFGFPRSLLDWVERGPFELETEEPPESVPSSAGGFRNRTVTDTIERARASADAGDLQEASRLYRKALETSPDSIVSRVELAELLRRRGDLRGAQTQLELAKRVAPEEPTVRELLGDVYYDRGRIPLAVREWQKALELRPSSSLLDKLKRALRENDQDIDFDEIRRPRFLIRYDGAVNEAIGREIAVALEQEYDDLAMELQFFPSSPIQVTLYTQREFQEVTHAPSWASALNDGQIRIPVEGVTSLTPKLRGLLRHELSHSFVTARTHGNCPTWLQEGIAQLRTGPAAPDMHEKLREAREQGTLLPLWSLEGPLLSYSEEQARLAYIEARAATQYLVDRKGPAALARILDQLSAGRTMNDALKSVVGLDYQELQTAWEADLDRYRPAVER